MLMCPLASKSMNIPKIGISRPLLSRSFLTRVSPMRATDITKITNNSFENKFKREREGRGLGISFLDKIDHKSYFE
jgi:hypothetical protein